MTVWLLGLLGSAVGLFVDANTGAGSRRPLGVLTSAWWATAFWVAGSAQMLWLRPADWDRRNPWLRLAALTWVLGLLMHLAHIAAAFHTVHHWSLAAAYRHTERTAGVGEGVFVNYLFTLVWSVDAVWLAALPSSYARRPRWVGWAVHGFLAFVVFNATVVYGMGVARWLGVAVFALLGWCWLRSRDR